LNHRDTGAQRLYMVGVSMSFLSLTLIALCVSVPLWLAFRKEK